MGRRRDIRTASRSPGPARAFVLTLAVGLLLGVLLGFFLGRVGADDREGATVAPAPPARTVTVENTVQKTVRTPEKTALKSTAAATSSTSSSTSSSASASP